MSFIDKFVGLFKKKKVSHTVKLKELNQEREVLNAELKVAKIEKAIGDVRPKDTIRNKSMFTELANHCANSKFGQWEMGEVDPLNFTPNGKKEVI